MHLLKAWELFESFFCSDLNTSSGYSAIRWTLSAAKVVWLSVSSKRKGFLGAVVWKLRPASTHVRLQTFWWPAGVVLLLLLCLNHQRTLDIKHSSVFSLLGVPQEVNVGREMPHWILYNLKQVLVVHNKSSFTFQWTWSFHGINLISLIWMKMIISWQQLILNM